MKITAAELKTGMTVRDGYFTIEISDIKEGTLKNGKVIITVGGKGIHKYTGSNKTKSYDRLELTFKASTKVNVI